MKKKSGHRRRTKVVRRSRKNLRRTVKRKSLGKGRRRPTRRYSRVQRGGLGNDENIEESAGTSLPDCVTIDEFKNYYVNAVNTVYKDRKTEAKFYNDDERKKEFDEWMKSDNIAKLPTYNVSYTYPYPVSIVNNILEQIVKENRKLCQESIVIIGKKIKGHLGIDESLRLFTERNEEPIQVPND